MDNNAYLVLADQLELAAAAIRELANANNKLNILLPDVYRRKVDSLGLSVRTRNCLQREEISIVGELCLKSKKDLEESNFYPTTIEEIVTVLNSIGCHLKEAA